MSITVITNSLKRFGAAKTVGELTRIAQKFTMVRSGRASRYNAMKVEFGGKVYDSLSEAYYAYLLDKMLDEGKVLSVQEQVAYRMDNHYGRNTLRYVADFVVTGSSGKSYVIDIKGRMTRENVVKYSYFTHVHGKKIHVVSTTGPSKFDTSFIV